jgi:hypothetical protein
MKAINSPTQLILVLHFEPHVVTDFKVKTMVRCYCVVPLFLTQLQAELW